MKQKISPSPQLTHDENILVVERSLLFPQDAWQGLHAVDVEQYLHIINRHQKFYPRSLMETDPTYKQIIPYLVFEHNQNYFLMQRRASASETRLQNKFSLGIGGHIRQEDIGNNSIAQWATREFHEEVDYADTFTLEPLGMLNDDSNPVGQVHVGFVFLLHGTSPNIRVKSELKSGTLLSLDECKMHYEQMESWSQIVYNFLASNR